MDTYRLLFEEREATEKILIIPEDKIISLLFNFVDSSTGLHLIKDYFGAVVVIYDDNNVVGLHLSIHDYGTKRVQLILSCCGTLSCYFERISAHKATGDKSLIRNLIYTHRLPTLYAGIKQ